LFGPRLSNPIAKYPPNDESVKDELKKLHKLYCSFKDHHGDIFSGEQGDTHSEVIYRIEIHGQSEDEAEKLRDQLDNLSKLKDAFFVQEASSALDKFDSRKVEKELIAAEAVGRGVRLVSPPSAVGCVVTATVSLPYGDAERDKYKPFGGLTNEARKEKLEKAVLSLLVDPAQHPAAGAPGQSKAAGAGGSSSGNVDPPEPKIKVEAVLERENTYCFVLHLGDAELRAELAGDKRKIQDLQKLAHRLGFAGNADKDKLISELVERMQHRKQARLRRSLEDLMSLQQVQDAGLCLEEASVAYQYTGPLFQVGSARPSCTRLSYCMFSSDQPDQGFACLPLSLPQTVAKRCRN
jgi:hypothetical protein